MQRRDTGRPELCYGRRCPPLEVEHSVRITDFALLYPDATFSLDTKIGGATADLLMTLGGDKMLVEIDNSEHMDRRQIQAKWRRYLTAKTRRFFLLVVTVTEGRMQRLRRDAELVKDLALFSTFARLQSGMPQPWQLYDGTSASL